MTEHTKLPWKMVSAPDFNNGLTYTSVQPVTIDEVTMHPLAMANGEYHVCRMTHTAAEHKFVLHRANAAFIVRAVNSYDALVKALEPLANIAQARDFDCEEPISDDDVVLTVPGYVGLKITMGDCRRALALSSNDGQTS